METNSTDVKHLNGLSQALEVTDVRFIRLIGSQAETHKLNEWHRVDTHLFIQCEVVVGKNAQYPGTGTQYAVEMLHRFTIMSS